MTTVRVYCRMRPFNDRETKLGNLRYPITVEDTEIIIEERGKVYSFDQNFDHKSTQEGVFNVVGRAVVTDFMDGFNATQFVYGQTGAGKSWTMMGKNDDPKLSGLIPRSSTLLFQMISERASGWKFEIEASYLEIYMERVNDLLDPDKVNLDVKEAKGEGVFIPGLTKESISCAEDVFSIIDRGDRIRKVAATAMNAGSSRSHSVLSLYLTQTSPDGVIMTSQLNLVDLAGSERLDKTGATGDVMKQGTLINLSLTVLSQVIQGLSMASAGGKQPPIPYRSSKLTRLLQTSLGGDAKTGLSIHVSPHENNLEESISTCEFGKRAKLIKNNAVAKVKKNANQLEKELSELTATYETLRQNFEKYSGAPMTAPSEAKPNPKEFENKPASKQNINAAMVSEQELDEERQRVSDLERELTDAKTQTESLEAEVANLKIVLVEKERQAEQVRQSLQAKLLEVENAQLELAKVDENSPDKNFDSGFTASQSAALAKLNSRVGENKATLAGLRTDSKSLKKQKDDLMKELDEKSRKLALAELQILRYENAKAATSSKIKVKIQSGGVRTAAGEDGHQWDGLISSQTARRGGVAQEGDGIAPTLTSRSTSRLNLRRDQGTPENAVELERMRKGTVLEKCKGLSPIPAEELDNFREGWLEEKELSKTQFTKRYFVLRDTLLLCYDAPPDQQGVSVTAPIMCVLLPEAKVGEGQPQDGREFTIVVLHGPLFTVLAAETLAQRDQWVKQLNYAKSMTHECLVSLAYFCSAAIHLLPDPATRDQFSVRISTRSFAQLGEPEYLSRVPAGGGVEGFLRTPGFELTDTHNNSMFTKAMREHWKLRYCVIRDAYLMLYDAFADDRLCKPCGVLHLANDVVSIAKEHSETEDPDNPALTQLTRFYFTVMLLGRDDESIALCAATEHEREKWLEALSSASLTNTRNIMTAAIDKEALCFKAAILPRGHDALGNDLDPLCVQPFDAGEQLLFRHPSGRTVNTELIPVTIDTPRYSTSKRQLDPFNRPLPKNAVPMFAAEPFEPVGVGCDEKHYAYPSARILAATDRHVDSRGNAIAPDTILAANGVVLELRKECAVRSAMGQARGRGARPGRGAFDAFGRILRRTNEGLFATVDGQVLPPNAQLFDELGEPLQPGDERGLILDKMREEALEVVYWNRECARVVLAVVGVTVGYTTLADVHAVLKKSMKLRCSMTFLVGGAAISEKEKDEFIASELLPSITVSCRDGHGKRIALSPAEHTTVRCRVDHAEMDTIEAKAREKEFIKLVTKQTKPGAVDRSSSSASLSRSGPAPTASRSTSSVALK